jgi:hypothetical protein
MGEAAPQADEDISAEDVRRALDVIHWLLGDDDYNRWTLGGGIVAAR